jgi:hypothetical protein
MTIAPVYRHLDNKATFAGLSFPVEWMLVLSVVVVGSLLNRPGVGAALAAALYMLLRVVAYKRPDHFVQHYTLFRIRAGWARGRFSGAARARVSRFPFGPYLSRDAAERR